MPRQFPFPIPNSQFPIPNSQFPILISILMIMDSRPSIPKYLPDILHRIKHRGDYSIPFDENIPFYMQPEVDFDKVLEQDMANGITIPRFAVKLNKITP